MNDGKRNIMEQFENSEKPGASASPVQTIVRPLLPCPFCGGNDVKLTKGMCDVNGVFVKTTHTGCEAEVLFYGDNDESEAAVIETWNKRQDDGITRLFFYSGETQKVDGNNHAFCGIWEVVGCGSVVSIFNTILNSKSKEYGEKVILTAMNGVEA